jgi:hypothetical protein
MEMDERARRIGQNEALFRQINENLEDLNAAFASVTGTFEIVCECGAISCVERIVIDPATYERLRANPTWFAVVTGHDIPDVESIVERHEGYDFVEKRAGDPAALASATDPRS